MHPAPLLWMMLLAQPTPAVPKAPEVGFIHPCGGRAGTVVNVQLAGFDWTPDLQFFFSDPRIKVEILGPPGPVLVPPPPYWFGSKAYITALPMPREIPARLTLPADLPPGPIRWQVANANGGSVGAGVFWIGDRPEVQEDEKARTQPPVTLPVAIHGRLSKIEEVDRYRFKSPHAGPITCELFARRLGANFNGVLEVRDSANRVVVDAADTEGTDVALTFAAKKDEEYVVSVRDVDFRGDRSFVHRLEITAGPRVVAAIPPVGRRGTTRAVEFVGYGIATGQAKLETVTRQVTFPKGDADDFLHRLETPLGIAPAFRLFIGDSEDAVIAPAAAPRVLTLPSSVIGCLDRAGAEDHFRVKGKKGDTWSMALESRKFGSPLDVALTVLGPDGKEAARNDDLPGTTDAGLQFVVPLDGDYTIVVSDLAGKSGSRAAVYRLSVEQARRDFTLTVLPRVSVPVGGKADLAVTVQWTGTFREAIGIRVLDLPPGVTVPTGLVIPKEAATFNIPFECAANAATTAARIRIVGSARHVGKRHAARATVVGNLTPQTPKDYQLDTVLLAVTMKPRCRLLTVVADGTVKVNRGATYPAELIVERLDGYAGEIGLQMAAQQSYQVQGISGPEMTVAPGATRAFYPCFMPEWLETTRTSRMIVNAVVKIPDPRGNVRYLVTEVQGRITMSIEGSLMKVSSPALDVTVQPGKEIVVPIRIARSPKFTETVKLELVAPEGMEGLLKMDPVSVPAGKTETTVRITTLNDPRLIGEQSLTIRATSAVQPGNLRVMSETTIPFAGTK